MHTTAEALIDVIRARGRRVTAPRRAICEVIAADHGGHLTAAGILEAVRDRGSTSIDQSTVYRTLEVLEEAGILTHSHLGHGASVYHLSEEASHQHLVCERCGRTAAVPERDLGGFFADITARTGFVPNPRHFAVSGLCAACAAAP
jgi:Fur family ferric uptake transcriptional regulator